MEERKVVVVVVVVVMTVVGVASGMMHNVSLERRQLGGQCLG